MVSQNQLTKPEIWDGNFVPVLVGSDSNEKWNSSIIKASPWKSALIRMREQVLSPHSVWLSRNGILEICTHPDERTSSLSSFRLIMRIILIIPLDFPWDFRTILIRKFQIFFFITNYFSMSLQVSTDADFSHVTASGLVLVDFWAEWCGPCQIMLPRLEELSSKLEGKGVVAKHNVDLDPDTPSKFRIMSIPTMILFKNGQPVEKWIGVQDNAVIESAFEKHA
jgi:thioredoxin 1